jgi:uncharacterized protein
VRRRHIWGRLVAAFFIVVVLLVVYGFAETYWLTEKDYTYQSPHVPASFDGLKIVLLTDIHRGPFVSQERVHSLVHEVNALGPDLILLGGDYVYLGTRYASTCFKELADLNAPLGVYGVLGNHDYGKYVNGVGGPDPIIKGMKDAGITLLRDEGVWINKGGQRIRLGGVSDYSVDRPDLTETVKGTGPADLVLLLSHEPDYAEDLPEGAVDLVLSGHTHGGQVTVFGKWAFHVPSKYGQKYRTGVVENDGTTVIVSNGTGTSTIPPIRIFCRPQIVVITLERGSAE